MDAWKSVNQGRFPVNSIGYGMADNRYWPIIDRLRYTAHACKHGTAHGECAERFALQVLYSYFYDSILLLQSDY